MISETQKATFLGALMAGHTVKEACRVSDIARRSAYHLRSEDPDFAGAWDAAAGDGTDKLEQEVFERALDRSDKYAHTLLMFLLKKRNPEFREGYKSETTIKHETVHKYDFSKEEMSTAISILRERMNAASEEESKPQEISQSSGTSRKEDS